MSRMKCFWSFFEKVRKLKTNFESLNYCRWLLHYRFIFSVFNWLFIEFSFIFITLNWNTNKVADLKSELFIRISRWRSEIKFLELLLRCVGNFPSKEPLHCCLSGVREKNKEKATFCPVFFNFRENFALSTNLKTSLNFCDRISMLALILLKLLVWLKLV